MELQITVTTNSNETDYDGNPITEKMVTSKIDGVTTDVSSSEASAVTDTVAKTNHRNKLTQLNIPWDTEI